MDESTDSSLNAESSTASAGRTIREARERAGLSLEQLAQDLHLPTATVDALERDDFTAIPQSHAYIRGYLRACARRLGLAEAAVIAAARDALSEEPVLAPSQARIAPEAGLRGMHWISGTVVVAVVALLAIWWAGGEPAAPESPEQLARTLIDNPDVEAVSSGLPPVGLDGGVLDAVAAPEEAVVDAPAVAAEAEPTPVASLEAEVAESVSVSEVAQDGLPPEESWQRQGRNAPGDDVIQLSFSDASWAEVYDANNQQLLYGLLRSGATRELRGTAPFQVMLGYAPGVEVRINGEYYDHLTRVRRNNTVRFNLASPSDTLE